MSRKKMRKNKTTKQLNSKKISLVIIFFLIMLILIITLKLAKNPREDNINSINNSNNTVIINFKAQSESGIKQVELPNGTIQYFNGEKEISLKYTVDKNSDYTFKVTELDGSVVEKVINISKIKEDSNNAEEVSQNEENVSNEFSSDENTNSTNVRIASESIKSKNQTKNENSVSKNTKSNTSKSSSSVSNVAQSENVANTNQNKNSSKVNQENENKSENTGNENKQNDENKNNQNQNTENENKNENTGNENQQDDDKVNIPDANGNIEIILSTQQYTKALTIQIEDNLNGQYDVYYKLSEDNEWKKYESDVVIAENTTVFVRYQDENGNTGNEDSKEITNIDNIVPNEYNPEATSTTNNITVSGTTIDNKTQASNLKYYYSIDNGENYTEEESSTYTFDNLNQNTEYEIAIKVADEAGNERIVKLKYSTLQIPEYDTSNVEYSNSFVNAKNINSEYTLLYAIGENGEFRQYNSAVEVDGFGKIVVRFKYKDIKNQEGNITKFEQIIVPDASGKIEIKTDTEDFANKVTVTLDDLIQKDELIVEYKIGENGDWKTYNESFDVTENSTVYARYVAEDDKNNTGKEISIKIENIVEFPGTIYFKKPSSWSNAHAYIFDNSSGSTIELLGAFPGMQMTNVSGDIYSIEISEETFRNSGITYNFKVKFDQGDSSKKTVNIDFVGFNKIYTITNETDLKNETGKWSNFEGIQEKVRTGKVYFEKPNEWATPYVYLSGDMVNTWPGTELKREKANIYYFEINESDLPSEKETEDLSIRLQFNNGGSNTNSSSTYKYKLAKTNFEGCNKIYRVTSGADTTTENSTGIWEKYVESEILGRIYFNKPVAWENPHAYMYSGSTEIFGVWPGQELTRLEDYIYYIDITNDLIKSEDELENFKIIFNNGGKYYNQADTSFAYELNKAICEGFNKIYNVTSGSGRYKKSDGSYSVESTGEWLDYSENVKIGKIPTTNSQIKNVIVMIGDGMGQNHIEAAKIVNNNQPLNMEINTKKTYVTTASTKNVTDSAASATALATGYKTKNKYIGKDKNGNDLQNIIEYAKSIGKKTGLVATQVLCHATPAGFSVHNISRENYNEIMQSQITSSNIDLMLGGGTYWIEQNSALVEAQNNIAYINTLSDIDNIDENKRVIGTFAEKSIGQMEDQQNRTSLADMTKKALSRLDNDTGFFVMIEGSDIDYYSHKYNMQNMLREMQDFDEAVAEAKKYVDNHSDTLLIITADHETGGLDLSDVNTAEDLTDDLFKVRGAGTYYPYDEERNTY